MKLEHREVVAFFYENVDMCKVVPAHRRINNVRLCNLMSQWKIKGYIDPDRVLKEKEKYLMVALLALLVVLICSLIV